MKYTTSILALMATILVFSCKKQENSQEQKNTTTLNTLEQKLVGRWQFVKSVDSVINADGTTKSVSDGMEECDNDDIYTFRADKKYTIDFGTKKCSTYESGEETIWSIRPDSNFSFDRIDILGDFNPVVINLDNEYFVIRAASYGGTYSGRVFVTNTYKRL